MTDTQRTVDYELGKTAYCAYVHAVGGKSIRGEDLPTFDAQRENLREAWIAAALAVAEEVRAEVAGG